MARPVGSPTGGVQVAFPEEPPAKLQTATGSVPLDSTPDALLDLCTRIAVTGPDLRAVAGDILEALRVAVGGDAALLLPDPGDRAAPVARGRGISAAAAGRLARAAASSGHPVLVADLTTDRRLPEAAAAELAADGARSYLCQPVAGCGSWLGTVHVTAAAPERFDDAAVRAAGRAARVLALVVQAWRGSAEADRRADERAREVTLLLDLSRALGDLTAPEQIPSLLLEHMGRVADPDLSLVLLGEGSRAEVTLQEELPLPAALRREAADRAVAEMRRVGGVVGDDLQVREVRSGSGLLAGPVAPVWQSELHLPLRCRDRVAGVVSGFATRARAFGDPERRLLTTVAGLVSLTLDRFARARDDERSRLASVVDAMGEGLLWADADGRLVLANPAGRRCLVDLLGEPQPGDLQRLGDVDLASLRREFAAGRRTRLQAEVGGGAGGRVYLLTASPVKEAGGMVLVLSDVTDRRQLQEKLIQAERLSALGEMISGVAHELNNPLAAVMGFAQLLEAGGGLDGDVLRRVREINEQAARCQRIVQNLLSFARPQRAERGPVDLNGVVRSVLRLLEPSLRADGVQVDLALCPDLPACLGDMHELQQALVNLVMNAHHAMQEAARTGRLRIATRAAGEALQVEVEDNGVGIPAQHLRRVFDPFFTTKRAGRGTGLGLSLVYSCITGHGGEIRVESRAGEFTRFVIDLPPFAGRPAAPAEAPVGPTPRPRRPGRRILVVDDEPAVAEFVALALRADGHQVEILHDGRQAREAIRDRRFDLVLTDLRMPRMSGRELYEDLVRSDPEAARRIIFSTGDTVSRETAEFLGRFSGRHLTKPFRLEELQALVDRVLGLDEPGPASG
jgi:two-component system NtrC family sensor kinase